MVDNEPDADISPLSQEFTGDGITVDVLIYRINGNRGWTLEVAIDDETSVIWAEQFPTDQAAWDEFAAAVESRGLRELIDGDDGEPVTVH